MRLNILLVAALSAGTLACAQNPAANAEPATPVAAASTDTPAPAKTTEADTASAQTGAVPAATVAEPAPALAEPALPSTEASASAGQTVVIITEASGPASTESSTELNIPDAPLVLPAKGLAMAEVEKNFGAPKTRNPTVGGSSPQQPPITRWDYESFSVIFEYDHVVHSVERDNPAPIQVFDGLVGGPTQALTP